MKTINSQIEETQWTQWIRNIKKTTLKHIWIKLFKVSDKEDILKAEREKRQFKGWGGQITRQKSCKWRDNRVTSLNVSIWKVILCTYKTKQNKTKWEYIHVYLLPKLKNSLYRYLWTDWKLVTYPKDFITFFNISDYQQVSGKNPRPVHESRTKMYST